MLDWLSCFIYSYLINYVDYILFALLYYLFCFSVLAFIRRIHLIRNPLYLPIYYFIITSCTFTLFKLIICFCKSVNLYYLFCFSVLAFIRRIHLIRNPLYLPIYYFIITSCTFALFKLIICFCKSVNLFKLWRNQ